MENKSFISPAFNIKNILSGLNKPAITQWHYSVDHFSVPLSVINVAVLSLVPFCLLPHY